MGSAPGCPLRITLFPWGFIQILKDLTFKFSWKIRIFLPACRYALDRHSIISAMLNHSHFVKFPLPILAEEPHIPAFARVHHHPKIDSNAAATPYIGGSPHIESWRIRFFWKVLWSFPFVREIAQKECKGLAGWRSCLTLPEQRGAVTLWENSSLEKPLNRKAIRRSGRLAENEDQLQVAFDDFLCNKIQIVFETILGYIILNMSLIQLEFIDIF